jgi:hypothetical protein
MLLYSTIVDAPEPYSVSKVVTASPVGEAPMNVLAAAARMHVTSLVAVVPAEMPTSPQPDCFVHNEAIA